MGQERVHRPAAQQRAAGAVVGQNGGHSRPEGGAVVGWAKWQNSCTTTYSCAGGGIAHSRRAKASVPVRRLQDPSGCSCPARRCGACARPGSWPQTAGSTPRTAPACGRGASALGGRTSAASPPGGPARGRRPKPPTPHARPQRRPPPPAAPAPGRTRPRCRPPARAGSGCARAAASACNRRRPPCAPAPPGKPCLPWAPAPFPLSHSMAAARPPPYAYCTRFCAAWQIKREKTAAGRAQKAPRRCRRGGGAKMRGGQEGATLWYDCKPPVGADSISARGPCGGAGSRRAG